MLSLSSALLIPILLHYKSKYVLIRAEYLQKLSGVLENGERIIKTADNCAKLMLDSDNLIVSDEGEQEEVWHGTL